MPPTRSARYAGSSILPELAQTGMTPRQRRREARRNTSQLAESSIDEPSSPPAPTRRRDGRHTRSSARPPSAHQLDEDQEITPRATRRTRTASFAIKHDSVKPTPEKANRRRPHVRPSLTGPQVEELTLTKRADMLADVAGDCLCKLLKSAVKTEGGSREADEDASRSWHALQTFRHTYIFPSYSPPFPLFTDLMSALHPRVRDAVDPALLLRAVVLSNLATFVWTILRPDEAGDLLLGIEDDSEDGTGGTSGTPKGKGKANDLPAELKRRVRRRNQILLTAWKRFWTVVVPPEKRANASALRLWLDFATQILLSYQHPSMNPDSANNDTLPPPSAIQFQDLFSPSAVGRHGSWDTFTLTHGEIVETDDEQKAAVEQKWVQLARRRESEFRNGKPDILRRRHPYEAFRREFIAFIHNEILGTVLQPYNQGPSSSGSASEDQNVSELVPDEQQAPPRSTPRKRERSSVAESRSSMSHRDDAVYREEANDIEETEIETTEESLGEGIDEDSVVGDIGAMDLDIFAEIAMELEEGQNNITARDGRPHNKRHRRDIATPSPQRRRAEPEVDEWAIREGEEGVPSRRAGPGPRFQFATRQQEAEQVGWDSQDLQHNRRSQPPLRAVLPQRTTLQVQNVRPQSIPPSNLAGTRIPASPFAFTPVRPQRASLPPQSAFRVQHGLFDQSDPHNARRQESTPAAVRQRSTSIRPGAELIRPTNVLSAHSGAIPEPISGDTTDSHADDEMEEEEEQIEAFGDLLPDTIQLQGHPVESSDEPRTPESEHIVDLLPDSVQLHGHPVGQQEDDELLYINPVIAEGELEDDSMEIIDMTLKSTESAEVIPVGPPTSQRALISTRPRKSLEALEFELPDTGEEAHDREMLQSRPSAGTVAAQAGADRTSPMSVKRSPTNSDFLRPYYPPVPRYVPLQQEPEDDPCLKDVDDQPLMEDPTYFIPRDYVPERSRIHGRVDGQSTSYSRISGRRKWSKAEEVLLYRTVQKVSLLDEYPLRVVWYLHGEYGQLSHALEYFNPQHMKDKMRVIVNARLNQRKLVEGRARFFLPNDHPGKVAFVREMEGLKAERQRELDVIREEERRVEAERKAREKEEKDRVAIKKASEKQKAGKKAKKPAKRQKKNKPAEESVQTEGEESGESTTREEAEETPTPRKSLRQSARVVPPSPAGQRVIRQTTGEAASRQTTREPPSPKRMKGRPSRRLDSKADPKTSAGLAGPKASSRAVRYAARQRSSPNEAATTEEEPSDDTGEDSSTADPEVMEKGKTRAQTPVLDKKKEKEKEKERDRKEVDLAVAKDKAKGNGKAVSVEIEVKTNGRPKPRKRGRSGKLDAEVGIKAARKTAPRAETTPDSEEEEEEEEQGLAPVAEEVEQEVQEEQEEQEGVEQEIEIEDTDGDGDESDEYGEPEDHEAELRVRKEVIERKVRGG